MDPTDPLWNRLPVFQAIAELQHLNRAAQALHVSPSAVSRTLRLLEDAVGQLLFDRVGRSLRLNAEGRLMLEAMLEARGRLGEALRAARHEELAGTLSIWSPPDLAVAWVLPAALDVVRNHPRLVPAVDHARQDLAESLRQGALDVAFVHVGRVRPGVRLDRLGALRSAIYCGPSHPLWASGRLRPDAVERWPFVVPFDEAGGELTDRWPAQWVRRVQLRVPSLELAIEACAQAPLLAVLPDLVTMRPGVSARLRRLRGTTVPEAPIFVMRRATAPSPRIALLLSAVHKRMSASRTAVVLTPTDETAENHRREMRG